MDVSPTVFVGLLPDTTVTLHKARSKIGVYRNSEPAKKNN